MAKQDVLDAIARAGQKFSDGLSAASDRIAVDFNELKRLISEGANTADLEAAANTLGDTIENSLKSIDPVPEFPPAPPEEPPA